MKTQDVLVIIGAAAAGYLLGKPKSKPGIGGNRTIRSRMYDFSELPESQQEEHREYFSDGVFVKNPTHKGEFLPLGMFMRLDNNKLWDGIYSTSAFSAYFIKISKDGEEAVVADRWF